MAATTGRTLRILVCLLMLTYAGAAQNKAKAKREKTDLLWDSMVWISLPVGDRVVRKAVLAINIAANGLRRPALMQPDLGTYQTVLYGVPYQTLGGNSKASQAGRVDVSGAIAGFRFQNERFLLDKEHGDIPKANEPAELGTVGADFFNNRLLLLDFVRDKLTIVDKSPGLSRRLQERVSFAPLYYRNGKAFVSVRLGEHEENGFFYDTGSSAFPLVTTRERWADLTGRKAEDQTNEVWKVKSWGNDAALIGAPLRTPLCVGRACIRSPMIYFESSGLENFRFDKYKYPASGLIGNAVFLNQYSVIVDLAGQRLGVLKGSLSERD